MKTNDYDRVQFSADDLTTAELVAQNDGRQVALPQQLDLLPMVELNIFPQLVYPISVEDARAKIAVHRSLDTGNPLALFAIHDLNVDPDNFELNDFYSVGIAARVHKAWETENGLLKVIVQGVSRIRLLSMRQDSSQVSVMVEAVNENQGDMQKLRPLVLEIKRLFGQVADLSPALPFNPVQFGSGVEEKPGLMADLMVAALPLKRSVKADFLGIIEVEDRLLKLLELLTNEVTDLETGQAIAARMKENMDKQHRERHLREQLKAIEAELGESGGENDSDDLAKLAERLHAKALPEEAREMAEKEFAKLKRTSSQTSEYGVIRNYVELILDLPWEESTFDQFDLAEAKDILDRDHYGLEKVKKRLVEFLAVRKLTGGAKSPILCLVGPPGVGKTSLGRSVASALGREFVRLSLGGVRDEAEIRGHRRTYVGALPGRIISGLKKVKSNNPVFLLDELDKMTHNMMGDPAAALLEVLDPEQNNTFSDHYLEIPFDLSKVLFILTANVLENIPGPLRDRLEIVEVSGYTLEEKMEITKRHLLPQELERHGLSQDDLFISDEAVNEIIDSYTREAGVRDLSRKLGALARSVAVEKAEGHQGLKKVDLEAVKPILGIARYQRELKATAPEAGVVTGLAWTAAGGDILFIESVAMPGKGNLSLTGQLGEVMQESAKAAISYVRSRAIEWGLDPDWFKNHDLHLHLPQGAIPKDGPSAGVTLATAIVSLARGLKVRPDVAMTGEISLRGLVLPVGGIKEKLLAAKRAGLSQVLIPEKNLVDLEDIPEQQLRGMKVSTIKNLDEALAVALIDESNDWSGQRLDLDDEMPKFPGIFPCCGGQPLTGEVSVNA